MPKFMCSHTLQPGKVTADQVREIQQATQKDPKIKGYRSFINLGEGKAMCVLEAPDKESLSSWFKKMNMPYDSIVQVELEGEQGTVQSV